MHVVDVVDVVDNFFRVMYFYLKFCDNSLRTRHNLLFRSIKIFDLVKR